MTKSTTYYVRRGPDEPWEPIPPEDVEKAYMAGYTISEVEDEPPADQPAVPDRDEKPGKKSDRTP